MADDNKRLVRQGSRGSETILVAEDEAGVRSVTVRALRRWGYFVLEAADAAEAMQVCDTHLGPIDLLLTDIVLPGMRGPELAEALWARRPDLKVIFMSGYTDDVIARHSELQPGTAFLEKPFTPDVLTRTVREVLDGRAGTTGAQGSG